uniref:Uncharacterized protein n=1 Tax=Triticum urartu TaxID=4572 RepID=A0A8R7QLX9_TRIUA
MDLWVVVDDLDLGDAVAVAAGDGVLEAVVAGVAPGGGAVALQRAAVRGDGDADRHARLVGAHLVVRPALVVHVELGHGGALRRDAPRPRAHVERLVLPAGEQPAVGEELLAVGARLDAQVQVVAAQVLHRHLVAVAGAFADGRHGRCRGQSHEQQQGQGLGGHHRHGLED